MYDTSDSGTGVTGLSESNWGVSGTSFTGMGVAGQSLSSNGVYGYSRSGNSLYGSSTKGLAALLDRSVKINGQITKAGGQFKIDHPLDPANKYLCHSFVVTRYEERL